MLIFRFLFFFNDTATTEIYTLSLHDALPISIFKNWRLGLYSFVAWIAVEDLIRKYLGNNMIVYFAKDFLALARSEEHTSELQSHSDLVCRLLLEKKKK